VKEWSRHEAAIQLLHLPDKPAGVAEEKSRFA
jgi:hypothetical protein